MLTRFREALTGATEHPLDISIPVTPRPPTFTEEEVSVAQSGIRSVERKTPELEGLPEVSQAFFKQTLKKMEEFLTTATFRSLATEGVPDQVIDALQLYHLEGARISARGHERGYLFVRDALVERIRSAAEAKTSSNSELQRQQDEAVLGLIDLVLDPNACRWLWTQACMTPTPPPGAREKHIRL